MIKLSSAVLLVALAAIPVIAPAQGGRGGGRGRGQRGQTDTTTAGTPRPNLSFADMVYAHRAQLQLTDSQAVVLSDIRMVAVSRQAVLNHVADSVRATLVVNPSDAPPPLTDSSRKAMMEERRALGSVLGEIHDVDVDARSKTLAILTPDQVTKAEFLEELQNTPNPAPDAEGRGKGPRGAGRGRPGGGPGGA